MSYKFNPFTGNFDISAAGSTTSPGGSDTQVQFNDGGSFGGDSGLTFNKTTNALTVGGATVTTSAPVLDLSQTWNDAGVTFTGLKFNVTDTASAAGSLLLDLQVGGSSKFKVNKNGIVHIPNSVSIGANEPITGGSNNILSFPRSSVAITSYPGTESLGLRERAVLGWHSNIAGDGGSEGIDTRLYRDAANTLAQRNSTNAQTFRLYNTYTDASNYERGKFEWASNVLRIGTEKAGTGSARALEFQTDGTTRLKVETSNRIVIGSDSSAGDIRFGTTNTYITYMAAGFGNGIGFCTSGNWNSFGCKETGRIAFLASDISFGWHSGVDTSGATLDLALARDAANTLAQRNSTNAQESRIYATYTSGTSYQRCGIKTAKTTLSNVSGASVTATSLIPAGAFLIGVTSRVNTALGTSNGTTGYQVGTASDPDLWGAITGTAEGTASGSANYTAPGASGLFTEATNVIVTAVGGNFDATGVIELAIHYLLTEAD